MVYASCWPQHRSFSIFCIKIIVLYNNSNNLVMIFRKTSKYHQFDQFTLSNAKHTACSTHPSTLHIQSIRIELIFLIIDKQCSFWRSICKIMINIPDLLSGLVVIKHCHQTLSTLKCCATF